MRDPEDDTVSCGAQPGEPVPFTIAWREEPGATVLMVAGELDLLTSPKLAAELDEAIRRGTEDAVVDLSETTFMDSSGIHVLLEAQRRLALGSRGLAVVCARGPARRTLEVTGLLHGLGVVSSFEEYEVGKTGQ